LKTEYVDQNRIGDHICYISDLRKFQSHYPGWKIEISLRDIVSQIIESWEKRQTAEPVLIATR
jgi:CDP-paratose 2-epimerase